MQSHRDEVLRWPEPVRDRRSSGSLRCNGRSRYSSGRGVVEPPDGGTEACVTGERWHQIESLFDRALEVAREELAVWLEANCRGDLELRLEIESLLTHYRPEGPNWPAVIGSAAVAWAEPE